MSATIRGHQYQCQMSSHVRCPPKCPMISWACVSTRVSSAQSLGRQSTCDPLRLVVHIRPSRMVKNLECCLGLASTSQNIGSSGYPSLMDWSKMSSVFSALGRSGNPPVGPFPRASPSIAGRLGAGSPCGSKASSGPWSSFAGSEILSWFRGGAFARVSNSS